MKCILALVKFQVMMRLKPRGKSVIHDLQEILKEDSMRMHQIW